jgi:hypothetical protein
MAPKIGSKPSQSKSIPGVVTSPKPTPSNADPTNVNTSTKDEASKQIPGTVSGPKS